MKTKLFTLLLLLYVGQLFAQDKMNAKEMATYQDDLMVKELVLTKEQKEKVSNINLKFSKSQTSLMNEEGSMFAKMGRMKKIGKAKNEALQEILTKEQFDKYKNDLEPSIRKHFRSKMKS